MNQTIYSYSTYSQSILSTAMNNLIYDHTHNLQSQLPIHTCLNHTIIVATHVTKITAFKCIIIIITVNFTLSDYASILSGIIYIVLHSGIIVG